MFLLPFCLGQHAIMAYDGQRYYRPTQSESEFIIMLAGLVATGALLALGTATATCGFFVGCKKVYDNHHETAEQTQMKL